MAERRRVPSRREQLQPVVPLLVGWLTAGIVIALAGTQRVVPVQTLFLDPQAIGGAPWYAGVLSSIGILCWTVSTVAAAGGAWVAAQTDRPSAAAFLRGGAIATAVLLVDDLFLLHSDALPKLFGTPKLANMVLVIAPTLAWVLSQRREIQRTRVATLGSAFFALGISVVADRFIDGATLGLVVEDGAKLFGIVAWMLYFVLTSRDIARSTINAAARENDTPFPDRFDHLS